MGRTRGVCAGRGRRHSAAACPLVLAELLEDPGTPCPGSRARRRDVCEFDPVRIRFMAADSDLSGARGAAIVAGVVARRWVSALAAVAYVVSIGCGVIHWDSWLIVLLPAGALLAVLALVLTLLQPTRA